VLLVGTLSHRGPPPSLGLGALGILGLNGLDGTKRLPGHPDERSDCRNGDDPPEVGTDKADE
jgi:hypothetical protein